ncbi:hypothetical protein ACHWQZ_G019024 [Mnemiopsis leidyi]
MRDGVPHFRDTNTGTTTGRTLASSIYSQLNILHRSRLLSHRCLNNPIHGRKVSTVFQLNSTSPSLPSVLCIMVKWDLDNLQSSDNCCGAATPLDWSNDTLLKGTWNTSNLPDSCCMVIVPNCGENKANATVLGNLTQALHKKGCSEVLKEWFDLRIIVIGAIAGATTVGEAVMVAISTRWIRFIELYW